MKPIVLAFVILTTVAQTACAQVADSNILSTGAAYKKLPYAGTKIVVMNLGDTSRNVTLEEFEKLVPESLIASYKAKASSKTAETNTKPATTTASKAPAQY